MKFVNDRIGVNSERAVELSDSEIMSVLKLGLNEDLSNLANFYEAILQVRSSSSLRYSPEIYSIVYKTLYGKHLKDINGIANSPMLAKGSEEFSQISNQLDMMERGMELYYGLDIQVVMEAFYNGEDLIGGEEAVLEA